MRRRFGHALVFALCAVVAAGAVHAPAHAQHPDDIYWTPSLGDAVGSLQGLHAAADQVYVGGNFTSLNGQDFRGLARWDGTTWHAMGDNSLAAHVIFVTGSTLYAGTSAGYYTGTAFSRWDGNAWLTYQATNIGLNNDASIADIVEFKGDIYVGGSFRTIGPLHTYGIARWDGNEWHDLAGGLAYRTGWYSEQYDGKVYSLAVDDDYLYVGGNFTHAGGVAASRLARWDGTQWLPFPDYSIGSTGEVAVAGGRLYTSGFGGSQLPDGSGIGIFMWDGTTWSSMNGGINDFLTDMTTVGDDLYIVGSFTRAGDVDARHVARWDGRAWTALGSGVSTGVGWGTSTGMWGRAIAARASGEVFLVGVSVNGSSYASLARFYNPCPYPGRPVPAHPARRVSRSTALAWEDAGAPGPATSWDLYFGPAADPPLVAAGLTERSYQPDTLAYHTTYYWRVVARDAAGNHATGSTWKFTTEPLITARLTLSPVSAYCGGDGPDTVVVDVSVEKTPGVIDAAGFDLPFDPAAFTFLGCEPAELTAAWDHFGCADRGGYVRVGGYDPDGIPAATSGVFARLRFAVDCCAFDSTASFALCATNLTDDLKLLTPFCAAATCTSYVHDGDLDGDSYVTSTDAVCAVESFVEGVSPCGSEGWDVRGDVDCSGAVTPRDALCIYRNWSGESCVFCGNVVAGSACAPATAPLLALADAVVEGDVLSLVVAVSGVASLEAFGFDVVYPETHVGYLGHSRMPLIDAFEWVADRRLGSDRARIGGFGTTAGNAPVQTDLLVIRMRIRDHLGGVMTLSGFVDDLAGAPDLAIDLETVTGITPPANAFTLAQNHPNPFNPLTTIRYEIPASFGAGKVRLAIYDVAGRRVRGLVDRSQGGGAYEVQWDGRDDRGGRVTSGVYFYVLDAGGKRLARKLVLLK